MTGWLSVWAVVAGSDARDVVREVPATAPEAWYLLPRGVTGGRRSIDCRAEAVVGADGTAKDARAVGCPAVLQDAIREALMRWRWERWSSVTAERVRVVVRAPSLTPRSKRGECLVGIRITGETPRLVAEGPRRCEVGLGPVAAHPPRRPRQTAWCAVDVVMEGGEPSLSVDQCAEGYAAVAAEAVQSWSLPVNRHQRWRFLLGYEPVANESVVLD